MDAIQKDFGDFKSFKQQLTTATVAIQGSGWGWLVSFIPVGFFVEMLYFIINNFCSDCC